MEDPSAHHLRIFKETRTKKSEKYTYTTKHAIIEAKHIYVCESHCLSLTLQRTEL